MNGILVKLSDIRISAHGNSELLCAESAESIDQMVTSPL